MDSKDIIRKIKEKKEFTGVPDSFIQSFISEPLPSLSDKQAKVLVKEIRASLRRYVGQYNLPEGHTSSSERNPYIDELKKCLQDLKPRSILDIGCGLNPLAIARQGITYYACDIQSSNIERINQFFKDKGIGGRAWVEDIRKATSFPRADVCLILKVVDLLDTKGHKAAEALIKKVDAKHIIISFSTKTLSGKPMNHPQRGWIERLLTRLGFNYQTHIIPNEIFYITSLK